MHNGFMKFILDTTIKRGNPYLLAGERERPDDEDYYYGKEDYYATLLKL